MPALTPDVRHTVLDSPIGELTMVRDEGGLTGLYFPGHWTRPDHLLFGPRVALAEDDTFRSAAAQLTEYLAGHRRRFDLPLGLRGSDQDRHVWSLLAEVPYGQTTTYGALARTVGAATNARAVGGAVGRNPLSIVIPCHRVLGSTGRLTGYAGGLARKRALLELEGAVHGPAPGLW